MIILNFLRIDSLKVKRKRLASRRGLNFYSELIKKDDLCFDIGANYGNRSEVFIKLGAKVVAFEPQPKPLNF